jgi:ribose transport system permease protein
MSALIERVTGAQLGGTTERSIRLALSFIRLGPAIILLLLILVMALLSPVFLTGANISNVAVQTSVLAILAIGQLFVILVAGIDLSIGSILGLTTVTGAITFAAMGAAGSMVSIVVMLLTGMAVGWLNGFLFVKGKMPHPFIPTLATLYAARGLALVLADGRPIPGVSPILVFLGSGYLGPIPMPVVAVAVLTTVAVIVTRRLKWGRWVYAVGGDKEAARRTGIPVDRVLISVFVISGLMAAFAGMITAGRTDAGFPTAGELQELTAIAAVIIGGASFFGGRGGVLNVIVGALIIGVIQNGLNLLNVNVYYQLVATGVIVVLAVELDVLRRRLEERFRTLQARGA